MKHKKYALMITTNKDNRLLEKTTGNMQFSEDEHEILFASNNLIECKKKWLYTEYIKRDWSGTYRAHLIEFTGAKRPNQFRVINADLINLDLIK